MEWHFINTGFHAGEFNMRFDMELAKKLQLGGILPTLRVYGWKPWAVSLGYNQKKDDVHPDKCSEFGFDIVRRPTGGRAILHANELTYSVVMPAEGKTSASPGITLKEACECIRLMAGKGRNGL